MRHPAERPVPSLLLALVATLAVVTGGVLAQSSPRAADNRMAWWRDARFGLFVHWGLYATAEGEWQGHVDHGEWIRTTARIPRATYDGFRQRFTAENFDADRWADLAAAAGMRYVVITTKHHDGFCLWPSDATDFDIATTPYGADGKDVMAEIARAFRARGLKVCWYHSIMDWHHDDYLPRRDWETDRSAEGADFDRFVAYLHTQVEELLTRYGPIGVMWFDGEWESTWTHARGRALYDLCRRLQPDVIVNNRVDKGRAGMAGLTAGPEYLGDFGTPEQEVPPEGLPGVDWESCMTMNRHWGWNRADTGWKSPRTLIRTLVDVASKGGNFLLNIGPQPDGQFPALAVERLEAIAGWMKVHAHAIHGTVAGPLDAQSWGRVTLREDGSDSTLYLCIFDWPADGVLRVAGLGNAVRGTRLMGGTITVPFTRDADGVTLALPGEAPHPDCSVVELRLVGRPIVYRAPSIECASDVFIDKTTVTLRAASSELVVRYTADGSEPGTSSPAYEAPIVIASNALLRARCFHRGQPVGAISERALKRVAPRPASEPEGKLVVGLWREVFRGSIDRLADLEKLDSETRDTVDDLALPSGPAREHVVHRYSGWLVVPADGVWQFALTSDDGSRLWLDGQLVVDNDGLHGAETKVGAAALAAGAHPVRVEWFNKTGGAELELRMGLAGSELARVAPGALRRGAE
ncbi:MAG: alpha-L-fucosidase [Planctomycetes bacterium]|nr:alpha-L-fucosidase [Planctomycetota bacterium]